MNSVRKWPGVGALVLMLCATAVAQSTVQSQEGFLSRIDPTVSPGEDFYQYANGGWFKRDPTPAPPADSNEIDQRLRRICEAAAAKNAPPGSDERLVGDFWVAGMDEANLEKGLAQLQPDLDRIDRARSIADLTDVIAMFHRTVSPRMVFSFRVEMDDQKSDRWMLTLGQAGLGMNAPAGYVNDDPRSIKVREAWRTYLSTVFLRLKVDRTQADMSAAAVFDLETQLARTFANDDQRTTLAKLGQLTPRIDWARYVQRLGVPEGSTLTIRSVAYFEALESLLRTVPLETWKDYLRFWLIRANAGFLDQADTDAFRAYDRVITGATGSTGPPGPSSGRWRVVIRQMRNFWLGQPLARLYLKEYVPTKVHAAYEAKGQAFRGAFRERIERLAWMSASTKQEALRKLARMRITVGFGDLSLDFNTMPLKRDSYVLNIARAREWFSDLNLRKLNKPVDKTAGDPQPSWSDLEYDDLRNTVVISVLAIGLPRENEEVDLTYAATSVAHEIAHGFDSGGRLYDADGKQTDWWSPGDAATFLAQSELLVTQYNAFMPLEGQHVDGRRTLRENMADVIGLRIALDEFKKSLEFKKNQRVEGFTPLQRFFLAYARRSSPQPLEAIASTLRGGNYAPQRERVNGPVMNMPEFYEAFGVKAGNRMYLPEEKRMRIW